MAIPGLTNQQHREILSRLLKLAETASSIKEIHPAGPEYHSLMACFLIHSMTAARSLEALYKAFGEDWFPTTVGYTIVRPMFEIDVTSHYITQDRVNRANRYIRFESILKKKQMDAWGKHRESRKADWREAMNTAWKHEWEPREVEIESKFESAKSTFFGSGHRNWSGKSIREMAVEVDHEEPYDVFYADLSSFTHADVRLADRFLRVHADGMLWTAKSLPQDVGGVFRYADIFLDCLMRLFGKEFNSWTDKDVRDCWPI